MEKRSQSNILKPLLFWVFVFLVVWGFYFVFLRQAEEHEVSYTLFTEQLERSNIESVTITEKEITGSFKKPVVTEKGNPVERFKTFVPFEDPGLVNRLIAAGVKVIAKPKSPWLGIIVNIIPWLLLLGLWFLLIRQTQHGATRAFDFGKSKVKILTEKKPDVTFKDVAGLDEAKEELKETIEFLKSPKKFVRLGGKIPKGVLLVGPPGTGKTLLARAVAGEAGVPFLSISGSNFVELFVGVGAARVRDLFEQAKRYAPCIIFIDEIDAVGRMRGAGLGGGHDEREQTLNQLLVEMDGFESAVGIIIMAATNRPDILDPALLRPGRFDRKVILDRPDIKGREEILKVHTRNIPLADDVDLSVLARGTPGFTGADLANMVNEAALLAARRNRNKVTMQDFEDAKDKVLMGTERRSLLLSDRDKKRTAYHEAGHALVSKLIPGLDPIHKVTIIPRGMALGITQSLPIDDRKIYSKTYCENQIAFMLGGRVAEEIIFGDLSTGAANDLDKATELARRMVCEWGMSEKLGPVVFGKVEREIFLGRDLGLQRYYSEKTAQLIDAEIRNIIETQHKRVKDLLLKNKKILNKVAKNLLEKEILTGEEIDKIIQKK